MRVLKNCCELKSTYVVIPDPEVRKQMSESLQSLMISDLTLFVHLKKSVSELDLNTLRDKCGSKRTPFDSKTSCSYLYDVLRDKIKNHYLQLHSKIIYNDKSWTKLLTRYLSLTEKIIIQYSMIWEREYTLIFQSLSMSMSLKIFQMHFFVSERI